VSTSPEPHPVVSPETASFLLNMLGQQSLNAGAEDLGQAVATVLKARAELTEVMKQSETTA
jgi:hypothetical protein